MAWNRSQTTGKKGGGASAAGSFSFPSVLSVAIVLLALGCAAWWAVRHDGAADLERQDRQRVPAMIAETKPSLPTKSAETEREKPDSHPGKVLSSTGVWQPADRPYRPGRKKVHAVHTNRANRAKGAAPFHNAAEQMPDTRQITEADLMITFLNMIILLLSRVQNILAHIVKKIVLRA